MQPKMSTNAYWYINWRHLYTYYNYKEIQSFFVIYFNQNIRHNEYSIVRKKTHWSGNSIVSHRFATCIMLIQQIMKPRG